MSAKIIPITRPTYQVGPIGLGWDWDRRPRTDWFPILIRPKRSGLYEVRGPRLELALRHYEVGAGWDYDPCAGDEWRGLRKCFFKQFSAPYREKTPPRD